jgi:hypothetical protein
MWRMHARGVGQDRDVPLRLQSTAEWSSKKGKVRVSRLCLPRCISPPLAQVALASHTHMLETHHDTSRPLYLVQTKGACARIKVRGGALG